MRYLASLGLAIVIAGGAPTCLFADVMIDVHYRCWDDTLRVSVGGWVSHRHIAEENCENQEAAYPDNSMWVEEESYAIKD